MTALHKPESGSPKLKISQRGYLVIAKSGDVLTPEIVKESSEDELVLRTRTCSAR